MASLAPRSAASWDDFVATSQGRRYVLVAFILMIVALLSEAPQSVGDGAEYMAMAHAFATGHSPALSPTQLSATETI